LRSAAEDDRAAMSLLAATCFGAGGHLDSLPAWRTLMPADNAVLACDGDDIVGMAMYFDLQMTVPGAAVVPVAGVTMVAVAPTHRRRGLLRAMFAELHTRIADAGYPIAALTASEGGIYGRFGYGPATIEHRLEIDRRFALFHADAPDPGAVRMVRPAEHHDEFAAIYERWRRHTPGGLIRPRALLEHHLSDPRDGGKGFSALLHPDGFAVFRIDGDSRVVRVEELTTAGVDGHVALWRALLGLDLMQTIVIGTHPDDPLSYLLTDPRVVRTTSRHDDLWLRITDIPAALEARTYRAELSTVLEISDEFRNNGGRFALTIRDGRARCTSTDAAAEVRMGLDVLGSLYLGAHHASALAGAGRVRGADAEMLRRLDAAFATEVPAELGFGF
jgi:predicted acetyltransferase